MATDSAAPRPKGPLQRGFTLIELLVVISIIALLSSVVLASLNAARDKARIAKARTEIGQIYNAFYAAVTDLGADYLPKSSTSGESGNFASQNAWYPPDCEGAYDFESTGNDRPNSEYAKQFASHLSTYMASIPLDPWGSPYFIDAVYKCTAG